MVTKIVTNFDMMISTTALNNLIDCATASCFIPLYSSSSLSSSTVGMHGKFVDGAFTPSVLNIKDLPSQMRMYGRYFPATQYIPPLGKIFYSRAIALNFVSAKSPRSCRCHDEGSGLIHIMNRVHGLHY